MKTLLALVALVASPFLSGCIGVHDQSQNLPQTPAIHVALAKMSIPELEARRAALAAQIASIETEVELKAGLPMSVLIADDRARLGELQKEASAIHQELLRRGVHPEGQVLRARL